MVRLENVSKAFGGKTALENFSLEIERGALHGLLGHNGAGKSTTFGILLGQVRADRGEAFINGFSVRREREKALAKTGAIFETPAFYDYLSGWRNLRLLTNLTGDVKEEEFRRTVELVGLSERIHDPVRTYSHGMRQRLGLAQALLPQPELLLLDEPTDGLDPEGIHEIRSLIQRLNREQGITVLFSSHLLSEVEQLCDQAAILHRGKLIFSGDWRQLELRGQHYEIELEEEWSPQQIETKLSESGAPVRKVEVAGRRLEDVYLSLVHNK